MDNIEDREKEIFDPETLSDDVKRYIDQERTRASKTARENALKEAINDENIRKAIKDELDAEAKQTAEERVEARIKELNKKEAIYEAKNIFANHSIPSDKMSDLLDLVVSEDVEITKQKATKMVESFATLYEKKDNQEKGEGKDNLTPPKQGGGKTVHKKFSEMNSEERAELKKTNPARFEAELFELQNKL